MTIDLDKRNSLKLLVGAALLPFAGPVCAQISDLENAEIDTFKDIRENLKLGGSALWLRGFNHHDGETGLAYEKVVYINACDEDTLRNVIRFFEEARAETVDNFAVNAGYEFAALTKVANESEPVPVMGVTGETISIIEGLARRSGLPYRLNQVAAHNRCIIAGLDSADPVRA